MATSIRLAPDAERWLRGLEDMEDYYLASDVLERVRNGTEKVHSAAEVRGVLETDG